MATILNFHRQDISKDYIITLKLPYSPYRESQAAGIYVQDEISASWSKDKNGVYNLSNLFTNDDAVWESYPAGLACIYRFLNETITNDLTIKIVQTDDFSEIQKGVEFKKLGDIKMKFQFYKGYLYDEDIDPKNKFLDCNNLKLYFMEKILMDLCEDDVKKIGCDELMLHGLNITFTRKQTKKTVNQKDGKPEKLRTVTSNTSDFSIDYKIDFIKLNDVKVFFQSIEENNEKQIAVFYHTGFVCSGTTQRIKKLGWNDAAYFETENEKALTSCSDWKVVTTGTDRVIRNLGNRVATSLSTYLRVTEKFIRNQSFNTLWEMCKTSA